MGLVNYIIKDDEKFFVGINKEFTTAWEYPIIYDAVADSLFDAEMVIILDDRTIRDDYLLSEVATDHRRGIFISNIDTIKPDYKKRYLDLLKNTKETE